MKIIKLYNNEPRLISNAAENNRQAQHELYQLYCNKMLAVCRRYIKDSFEAEEAMLNGFYKVFTHLKEYRNEGSFEGWVRKIMVRESISYLRQKKTFAFEDNYQENDHFLSDAETFNAENDFLEKLVETLPEGYKLVFMMFVVEGYKHQEIAQLLNIDEGTSKSQLFKARKMLQEKLTNHNRSSYETR